MNRITFTGVVAMAEKRAIGFQQAIPWHLAEDMRLFRRLTKGHPILMGRRTWESLGRPLPERQNIVLTRCREYEAPGALVIHSVSELRKLKLMAPEVMVIGGAEIYAMLLPRMKRLHVSEVKGSYEADTYFPEYKKYFSHRRVQKEYDGFAHVLHERRKQREMVSLKKEAIREKVRRHIRRVMERSV